MADHPLVALLDICRAQSSPGRITTGSSKIGSSTPSPCIATILGLDRNLLAAFTVGAIRGMTSGKDERQEERLDAVALGIFVLALLLVCRGFASARAFVAGPGTRGRMSRLYPPGLRAESTRL